MNAPIRLTALSAAACLLAGCATPPSPTPTTPRSSTDEIVRLQIFLDDNLFGPGTIDGRMGEFTGKARARYLRAKGLPPTASDREMGVPANLQPYTTYTITEADLKRIGTVAATPAEQAKQKSMPYTSVVEYVAERYHSSAAFLDRINPDALIGVLRPGDVLRVPNVKPFRIEEVSQTAQLPKNGGLAGRRIQIDTRERMLDVLEGDRLIASFPITPGSSTLPAPPGDWRIVGIATMPWFRYDEGVLKRGERTDDFHMIPAGPNSPVGVLWMGLSKPGIGIHGTNVPITIGRAASHGCIRLANWDAARMPSLVTKGCTVRID